MILIFVYSLRKDRIYHSVHNAYIFLLIEVRSYDVLQLLATSQQAYIIVHYFAE